MLCVCVFNNFSVACYAFVTSSGETNGGGGGELLNEQPTTSHSDVDMAPPVSQLPVVCIERQVYSQQDFFQRYPPMDKETVGLKIVMLFIKHWIPN